MSPSTLRIQDRTEGLQVKETSSHFGDQRINDGGSSLVQIGGEGTGAFSDRLVAGCPGGCSKQLGHHR